MDCRLEARIKAMVDQLAREYQQELADAGTLVDLEELTCKIGDEVSRLLTERELARRGRYDVSQAAACPDCGRSPGSVCASHRHPQGAEESSLGRSQQSPLSFGRRGAPSNWPRSSFPPNRFDGWSARSVKRGWPSASRPSSSSSRCPCRSGARASAARSRPKSPWSRWMEAVTKGATTFVVSRRANLAASTGEKRSSVACCRWKARRTLVIRRPNFPNGWRPARPWPNWPKSPRKPPPRNLRPQARKRFHLREEQLDYEPPELVYRNNPKRMNYPHYRRQGLPLTSSHIESTIKQINQRIKGTEKFWRRDSGDAVLQLRADSLSDSQPLADFWQRWQSQQTGSNHYQTAT